MNKNVKVTRDHNGLNIKVKLKSNSFMIFFSLLWNAITYTVLGTFLMSGSFNITEFNPAYILFISHPLVGLITAYIALRSIFGYKVFKGIYGKELVTTSTPFPLPRETKSIRVHEIKELSVKTYLAYRHNNRPVYKAKILINGDDFAFGIDKIEDAEMVASELSRYLGIEVEQEREKAS